MPFTKGNTIGQATRFKTGQSGNPPGRPPDRLRRHIYAELDKIEREATGKHEAVTKLQVLAERIVERIGNSKDLFATGKRHYVK